MIRTETLHDFRSLDNLSRFAGYFATKMQVPAKAAFNTQVRPGLLAELQFEPQPAVHPFKFATPASRGWYFWQLSEGNIPTDGKRYKRQHIISQAWKVGLTIGDNSIAMFAENKRPEEKWVSGKRQVPGHRTTGWPLHADTIMKWKPVARSVVTKAVKQWAKAQLG